MKIVNVTPGLIPIPPNGWGAVEKIIWETHTNLQRLGHDSIICYLDSIPPDADIVHIHVANLALLAHEKGIPYYFTCHDHHAYLYGKESHVYKENLEAMRHSIKSFVPAKYLVEYFEGIPQYFSHGVNTEFFHPIDTPERHRILCVANNGYIHNQSEDRKGFGIAIEVARSLNLPITVAGPSNNKQYFEQHPPTYDGLTIVYDLTENELQELYRTHSIFVHPSELEAGHPNLTLLEAMASGLPVVGTLEPNNRLNGMVVTSRDVVDVTLGIQEVMLKYPQYRKEVRQQAERLSWYNRTKELMSIYLKEGTPNMKKQLMNHYSTTKILGKPPALKHNFNCIDGMFFEILGGSDTKYRVKFINKKTNTTVYETELSRNSWGKTSTKYYVDWQVEVQDIRSGMTQRHDLNLKNHTVYIALDSKSLGDTLAWIPYVEEFGKQHNCTVVCSTFWNDLLASEYPNITFVSPGTTVHGIIAMYQIGLFYGEDGQFDVNKHPSNPIQIPLQRIAADILGVPYREIRPRVKQTNRHNGESKQITIAVHSTAQAKYWNNPTGWQEVVDWLRSRGYTVKMMSNEHDGYMGNRNPQGIEQHPPSDIDTVITELTNSRMFIGISSGLSWLSWAVGTPTTMISGFTDPINEMEDCIRISAPKGKCSGCWSRHKFNPGDWNWCPDHKGTPRQFECSREITSDMVIRELEKIL